MSKNKAVKDSASPSGSDTAIGSRPTSRAQVGRKRDQGRSEEILDAALAVLAESGYERTTIDMVAARAGAARATVYRRWDTKADLVVDALAHLSHTDVDPDQLPDTGSLREDMIASIRPHSTEEQQLRIDVISGVQTLAKSDPRVAEAALGAGIEPWIQANRALLQRAIDRGEFPANADVATLSQVIPMACMCRTAVQQQPITTEFSMALIDGVILPALRGSH